MIQGWDKFKGIRLKCEFLLGLYNKTILHEVYDVHNNVK